MAHGNIVAGVFSDLGAAERARGRLIEAGISERRILLTRDVAADDIAAEYPGQGYSNQPGQRFTPEHIDPCGAQAPGGGCELRVELPTDQDGGTVERILQGCGAQRTEILH